MSIEAISSAATYQPPATLPKPATLSASEEAGETPAAKAQEASEGSGVNILA